MAHLPSVVTLAPHQFFTENKPAAAEMITLRPLFPHQFFTNNKSAVKMITLRPLFPHQFFSNNKKYAAEEMITLRPFCISSDVDHYMTMLSDERLHQFFDTKPIVDKEAALKDLEEFVIPHPWYRAVCLGDRLVGYICFDQEPGQENSWKGEIEYALSPEYWGRGIATRAVKMAVSDLFTEFEELEVIHAFIVAENVGSRKVAEKAGFRKDVGFFNEDTVLENHLMVKGKPTDSLFYYIFNQQKEKKTT